MRRRRTPTIPLAGRLAVPLLTAALVLTSCTPAQEPGPVGSATAAPDTSAASPPGDSAQPGPDKGAEADGAGTRAKADDTGGPTAPKPDRDAGEQSGADGSGGQSGGDGSEVAPPAPDRSSGDSLGDMVGAAAGKLAPEQRTGTAAGLVAGFPDDVVLVPAGATVTSSSVTGTDDRFQVTLEAKVDGACAAAALDYRSWFTTGGFTETGATAQPDRATVDLARDDGTVQLGTTRTRAGCEVTVFATLSAR